MTDFSTDMTQKLKAGGEEGIKIFLGMARMLRANAGNQGIVEWVQAGFPALPPKDHTWTRSRLAWTVSGRSVTSSMKRVPPSAISNFPEWARVAPVKAPRSWPKSSLSRSSAGNAAQFTLTNGRSFRGER